MKKEISIFWFRRDLRLEDNVGLSKALASEYPVFPLFIFDEFILNQLEQKSDRRVDYIHQALTAMNKELHQFGATLNTFYGSPLNIFQQLSEEYSIKNIFCNRDYEPAAIARDKEIYNFFKVRNVPLKAFKDQVIFDKKDVLKNDGLPYTVFTPFSKKWKSIFKEDLVVPVTNNIANFFRQPPASIISLSEIGFFKTDIVFQSPVLNAKIIDHYAETRDYPAIEGTTHLGIALRFGTISIRKCVAFAQQHNQIWLNELIWREFFMQILYHFPSVVQQPFKPAYANIQWRNNEDEFQRWCEGKTGYPLVDAGMRELNETGYMHNRVRMVTASFLSKHLLIDWRWGEAYFAQQLNDYDLSANNGNWQWAAGCGCDAAPYFRVFNPTAQMEKFDKNQEYVRKWVPEYQTMAYPKPIVAHQIARDRALKEYGKAVAANRG